MAVDLDHTFPVGSSVDETYAGICDLERLIPLVQGGKVLETTGPDSVKAEIVVKMGAMSMRFYGTVEIVDKDEGEHRADMRVKSKEDGGAGYANADVTFTVSDSDGKVHTHAQISGKAASMGEGVVYGVLDGLIKDFTSKIQTL